MKLNLKSFFTGILVSTVLFSSTLVFAETSETIQAIFGRVKLMVNGTPVAEETLLYNGTTYVPLRAAANILGMEIDWNEATSTASLNNSSKNASTPVPTPAPSEAPVAPIEPPVTPPPASSKDNTTAFYEKYPNVPDYGETYGVKLEASSINTSESVDGYYYAYIDKSHKEDYYKLLVDNGFEDVKHYINTQNNDGIVYAKAFVKDNTFILIMEHETEDGFIIGIMVIPEDK